MAADASAHAVLGLEPGADWAAVELAYKTLIKAHHPDRPGGDGGRAAEINRAYRELRRQRAVLDERKASWPAIQPMPELRRRRRPWLAAAVGIAGAALLLFLTDPSDKLLDDLRMRAAPIGASTVRTPEVAPATEDMDQPLRLAAIRSGVAEAKRLAATRNETAMAEAAGKCQSDLQARPSLAQLDRCAAFDDAIVHLEARDPWHDDGPFGQASVTEREMSAANLFSDDVLAIDGRLDRVRLQVELALAPPDPAPDPLPDNIAN